MQKIFFKSLFYHKQNKIGKNTVNSDILNHFRRLFQVGIQVGFHLKKGTFLNFTYSVKHDYGSVMACFSNRFINLGINKQQRTKHLI